MEVLVVGAGVVGLAVARALALRGHEVVVAEAAEAVASGRFDPEPLYTHEYRLDQLDAAMDAMLQRPDGFVKAMVVNR